jgi:hypothetical protein
MNQNLLLPVHNMPRVEPKENPMLVRRLKKTGSTTPIGVSVKTHLPATDVTEIIGVATTDLTAKNVVVETKTDTAAVRTTIGTTIMMRMTICRSTKEK